MEQIRFLTSQDKDEVEQMKQIWRECFEAEDAYLNLYFFFAVLISSRPIHQQDKVLGMLTHWPAGIEVGEREGRPSASVVRTPEWRKANQHVLPHADCEMQRQEWKNCIVSSSNGAAV